MTECNEFSEELGRITRELHVISNAVQSLHCTDCTTRDGLASLIDTVATKVCDMSRGRTEGTIFVG